MKKLDKPAVAILAGVLLIGFCIGLVVAAEIAFLVATHSSVVHAGI